MAQQQARKSAETAAGRPSFLHRPPAVRLLLLAAVLAAAAMLGVTAARYLQDWSNNSLVTAGDFYFTSSELDGTLHRISPDESGKTVPFTFTLKNYAVADFPTQNDIMYTCAAVNQAGDTVDVTWNDGGSTGSGGTIAGKAVNDRTITCLIPVAAFGADGTDEVTVSVVSTAPYAKTLTAQVALAAADSAVVMKVTDRKGSYGAVAVTFYNTGQKDCLVEGLKLKVSEFYLLAEDSRDKDMRLVPDPTWETQATDATGTGTLLIPAQGTVSLVLLKRNTEDVYSESDFTYTVAEAPAATN